MKNNKIFPEIIEKAIYGLDNKNRIKILSVLYDNPQLSFSQLTKEIQDISVPTLNYHLKELLISALIKKVDYSSEDSLDHSYYSISTLGTRIIDNLLSILYPKQYSPPKVTSFEESSDIPIKFTIDSLQSDSNSFSEIDSFVPFLDLKTDLYESNVLKNTTQNPLNIKEDNSWTFIKKNIKESNSNEE